MIRQAHERPEGMDEGILIMAGLERERVLQAIDVITTQYGRGNAFISSPLTMMSPMSPKKVVRIIMSYVDYINRSAWYQPI